MARAIGCSRSNLLRSIDSCCNSCAKRQRTFIDRSHGKAASFHQSAGKLTAASRSVAGLSALEKLMEKKTAGLLGAVATLGTLSTAQAAPAPAPVPTDALQANSFADLLEPIPNAKAL